MNRLNWKKVVVVLLVAGFVCLLASQSTVHAQSSKPAKKKSGSGARAGKKSGKGGGSSMRKSKARTASSMRKSGARKSMTAKKSKGRGASAMRKSGSRKPATAKKSTGRGASAMRMSGARKPATAKKNRQAKTARPALARKGGSRNALAKANKNAGRTNTLGSASRRGTGQGGGGRTNGAPAKKSAARKALEANSRGVAGLDRLGVVDGVPVPQGLKITEISPGSPAEHADLVIGDVIIDIEGFFKIRTLDDLNDVLEEVNDVTFLHYISVRTGVEQPPLTIPLRPLE